MNRSLDIFVSHFTTARKCMDALHVLCKNIFSCYTNTWTTFLLHSTIYLSTVKQTRFHVEEVKGPHKNNLEFQIPHSRSPNTPLLAVWYSSFTVIVNRSKVNEESNLLNSAMKSMPLIYHLQLTKFIQSKLIRLSIWSKCSFVMQQLEHHY